MTVVGTGSPPPLPVRDRAANQARARARALGAVSPMLARLAEERATGVLVREHGSLHLTEGRVVHAESPHAPGLDVLLTARGPLDPDTWRRAADRAGGAAGAVRLLGETGALGTAALEMCLLGALYDAGYFALAPSSTPGRFRYGDPLAPAPARPVPVAELERETLRRRELLERAWPDPATDARPLVRARPVAAPPVPARARAVLERMDGVRTAREIARELGRPAFHTLLEVRRLAAAGFVVPGPAPPVSPPPAGPSTTAPPARPAVHPTVHLTTHPTTDPTTDPDIALLKRLRDALEAL
ncbi:transcriptional regulator [Streptomyces sp. NPDC026672]|uniref:transcriptional regulator n=1 Tax=unclassified Streptomyces TaxID=2593676 RepID=UPI0033F8E099